MGKADGLSRQPDWQEGVGRENEDRTLVKKEWLEARTLEKVVIEGVDILDRIRKSKAVNDEIVKVVEENEEGECEGFKERGVERGKWADAERQKDICAEG